MERRAEKKRERATDKKGTFINIRKVERGRDRDREIGHNGEERLERWKGVGREDWGGLLGKEGLVGSGEGRECI